MVNTRRGRYSSTEEEVAAHSEEPAVKRPKAALGKLGSRKRGNGEVSSEEPIQKRSRKSNDSGYGSSNETENTSPSTTRKILRAKRRHSEIGTTQSEQAKSHPAPKKALKIIRGNRFFSSRIQVPFKKMVKRSGEASDVCEECSGENRCSDDYKCPNRKMKKECPRACKEAGGCSNRFITEKRGLKIKKEVALFQTKDKGYGIKSKVFVPKGTYIGEYVGEIIDGEEKEIRYLKKEEGAAFYIMAIGKYFIDSEYYGNYLRYINHSCDPNCYIQKYLSADGTPHMCLFALKDIAAEEELTYIYSADHSKNEKDHDCYCEADHCTGKFKA